MTPADAGLDPTRLRAVEGVLEGAREKGLFDAAVLWVVRRGGVAYRGAYGVPPDAVFDLASLTKVVATVPLALRIVEKGIWQLYTPIAELLPLPPALKDAWRGVTIRHLLTHTAGLPAWVPLFGIVTGLPLSAKSGWRERDRFLNLWVQEATRWPPLLALEFQPGARVRYSDVGYWLLGWAIEREMQRDLDSLASEEVFIPLGMSDTCFRPLRCGIPPELVVPVPGVEKGVVHDENARALGGVAGHAGLFASAGDLAVYLHAVTRGDMGILSPSAVEAMLYPYTQGLGERRGLGWMLYDPVSPPPGAGDLWTDRAFGHTGFTGVSIWSDPSLDLAVVLLTNGVGRGREMASLRARIHNVTVGSVIDR